MKGFLLWTLWNVWLAIIPIGLGYAGGELGQRATAQQSVTLRVGVCVVGFLWLAFLPNTCYLITEWRHFLERVDRGHLYTRSQADPQHLFDLSLFALFYFFYSGFGVLALTLAIRPIERLARLWRWHFPLLAPPLFMSLSIGVYLGLILRLNSWDLWQRPRHVVAEILTIPSHPMLSLAIIVFGFLLWGLYEAMDIWVDGIKERMGQWKQRK